MSGRSESFDNVTSSTQPPGQQRNRLHLLAAELLSNSSAVDSYLHSIADSGMPTASLSAERSRRSIHADNSLETLPQLYDASVMEAVTEPNTGEFLSTSITIPEVAPLAQPSRPNQPIIGVDSITLQCFTDSPWDNRMLYMIDANLLIRSEPSFLEFAAGNFKAMAHRFNNLTGQNMFDAIDILHEQLNMYGVSASVQNRPNGGSQVICFTAEAGNFGIGYDLATHEWILVNHDSNTGRWNFNTQPVGGNTVLMQLVANSSMMRSSLYEQIRPQFYGNLR